jgi:serine/threonine protein kinase
MYENEIAAFRKLSKSATLESSIIGCYGTYIQGEIYNIILEYARKEIIGEDANEFGKEKTALEKIAALKDDHLVQIKKTYQLGDKFNILFPCARTNLFEYLRDTKWLAP